MRRAKSLDYHIVGGYAVSGPAESGGRLLLVGLPELPLPGRLQPEAGAKIGFGEECSSCNGGQI